MLVAMVAKRLEVYETIIRLDREEYAGIAEAIGVDAMVMPRLLTASTIMRLLRKGKVHEIAFVQQGRAEVIDVIVAPDAPITARPLSQLGFPEGAIVAMVVRGEQAIIPHGATTVRAGDRVVVFALHEAVPTVEKALAIG
jgi:trk system potassium uptake protein TrkA